MICILHHTAVSYKKNPDQFEATNNYHKKKWNSKSSLGFYVGYQYEISYFGKVRQARKDTEMGIHCKGHNFDSIGIAMDGNFDIEMPSEVQVSCLRALIARLDNLHHFEGIYGHRNFANKTCPGKLITDNWIKDLISKTKKMKLKIDSNNDLYIVEDSCKFGWSIPEDKIALPEVKTHFERLGMKLEKPELFDPTSYFIIHGSTKGQIREFFNT